MKTPPETGVVEIADPSIDGVLDSCALPELPDDCLFGDGGALETLNEPTAPSSSSEARAVRQRTVAAPSLPPGPFISLLSSSTRLFTVGSGTASAVLHVLETTTEESKGIVARVYSDCSLTHRLGTLSTAMPLKDTDGLKAVCDEHKEKKLKPCMCWIRLKKATRDSNDSNDVATDILKALCDWLASAPITSREQHLIDSETLRAAAGMKVRHGRGRGSWERVGAVLLQYHVHPKYFSYLMSKYFSLS